MTDDSNGASRGGGNDRDLNPFDPKRLRIGQRFGEGQDVRRILVSVPVRKPNRQEFIRTHPDAEMWMEAAILELKHDRQTYIVSPELAPYLPGEAVAKVLFPTVTNHGVLILWPVRLPDEQGRLDEWNAAAQEAAQRAQSKWVRVMANISAGTYEVLEAAGNFPDPSWPEKSLEELLEIAFKGRVIDTMDHPALKKLRGEF